MGEETEEKKQKDDLSVYFQAIKRAEHIYDTITNIRELAFGAAIALPVIGLIKDFILNSTDSNAALSYITVYKDFNSLLIHDIKIPFIFVFSIISVLLVLFTKIIEVQIYRPKLEGVFKYLEEFEEKASENNVYIGFKKDFGLIKYERNKDNSEQINKLYNIFGLGCFIIGAVLGYLVNIDPCRAHNFFSKVTLEVHFQCSIVKKTINYDHINNLKTSRTTETKECGCVPDSLR
ncbi:hypothetical protein [Fluviispira multicolorata]|uniref:Uncharacterized protein n=1 Tax=Fluviispira multicolorata TaxID=2654512 RepID=A0A833JGA9_9BACT|nr:hypothetical protein [Fluviispira multicolorata]KAB8032097.1 hypothetical protein GCL57_05475 [Fluviispira multicolorata]